MPRQVSKTGRLDMALVSLVETFVNMSGNLVAAEVMTQAKPLLVLGAVHYAGPQTRIGRQAKKLVRQVEQFQPRQILDASPVKAKVSRSRKTRTVKTGDGIVYEPEWIS